MQAAQEKYKKRAETGRALFGSNDRCGYKTALSGTLWAKNDPRDFKIGDWGCTSVAFRVVNKVGKTECLVLPLYKGAEVLLVRGLDMSKVTDGAEFILQQPVWIDSTYDYTAVSGA